MIPFVFVTQSRGKLGEAERILGQSLEHCALDLPELQSVEVEDVVLDKAKRAYAALGEPVMIEDTGLYIEAWAGLPGALIKWFVQSVQDEGICRMLRDFPHRRAKAKTVVAIYDGKGDPTTFTGEVEGIIAMTPKGKGGFGWDRLFIPDGAVETFGEMLPEEKDSYSMRCKAFRRMQAYYLSQTASSGEAP